MIYPTNNTHWLTLPTAEAVALAALSEILKIAELAIRQHGRFKLVLAGGGTPQRVYQLLAGQPCDWSCWHLYLGDERCLPVNHSERNSNMIRKALLNRISIPAQNVHFITAELGAEVAAHRYAKTVEAALPFDMVLLGMGEDGHTASLFPGQLHPQSEPVHAVYNAPKPPAERVSLSVESLSNTGNLLFLICGEGKKSALAQWQQGGELPASSVHAHQYSCVMMDEAASPG